jgi:serralysin
VWQATQASAVKTYNLTTDARFNALLQADPSYRLAWSTVSGGKTQVTYSFIWGGGVASQFATGYGTEMTAATVGALPSSEYANVALAFQQWANVANITFKQATETAAGGVETSALACPRVSAILGLYQGQCRRHGQQLWRYLDQPALRQ